MSDSESAAASASAPAAAEVSTGTSSRGRERKTTSVYVPPSPIKRVEQEFIIEAGKGVELGSIENIRRRLDATNAQSDEVKACFFACFPHMKGGHTKLVIKKHIRAFSGYSDVAAHSALASEKLDRYHGPILKLVAQILDISEGGTKAKLIQRITEFLSKPTASGHAYKKASASGSTKKASKRKAGSEDKPKRAPTSFMLFSNENRAEIRKQHPDMDIKDVARTLGEKWRALSEKEKQAWKDRATAGSKDDSSSDEDEEEEEEEERPKKKVKSASGVDSLSSEWRDKFSASVSKILTGADLSQVSMGSVKKQIAAEHGELIVEAHGQAIKEMVIEAIKAQSTN